MIKQEFAKLFKSKKSRMIFIVLNLIAIIQSIYVIVRYFRYYDPAIGNKSNAAYASLLSNADSIIGFAAFFEWLFPIYFMLAYCDKYVIENRRGMHNVYLTKVNRKKLFFSKILTSFFVPYIFCGIPYLINLGINSIFLHDGNFWGGMEYWDIELAGEFLYNSIRHPYSTYFLYLFFSLFVSGLLSIMCQSLSMAFKDNKMAYIISFSLWLGLYFSLYQLDINEAMQPFIFGYTLKGAMFAILKFLPAVFVPFIFAYLRVVVKKDEI